MTESNQPMYHKLLLIPTLDPNFSASHVSSFHPLLERSNTTVVIIYNGSDETVTTDLDKPSSIKIGCYDSELLANHFAEIAECDKELLFGDQMYGRGYGGALNLLLAIACAMGGSIILKVDDDIANQKQNISPRLETALKHIQSKKVLYGTYHARSTMLLRELPSPARRAFAAFVYESNELPIRLAEDTQHKSNIVRNGILLFTKDAAKSASYPVLFEKTTETKIRGEVYFWVQELLDCGFSFVHKDFLDFIHYPTDETNLSAWLKSVIVGFDLSFVHRTLRFENRMPSNLERRRIANQFQSCIVRNNLRVDLAAEDITHLFASTIFNFTDRILADNPRRKKAWSRLMNSNLCTNIENLLPGII